MLPIDNTELHSRLYLEKCEYMALIIPSILIKYETLVYDCDAASASLCAAQCCAITIGVCSCCNK